jgi:hypothetical protein
MPDQEASSWEPQLKYSELQADAPLILARDEASAFQTSDKLHVLGCASGRVHVLDFEGNRVSTANAVCMQKQTRDRKNLQHSLHTMHAPADSASLATASDCVICATLAEHRATSAQRKRVRACIERIA